MGAPTIRRQDVERYVGLAYRPGAFDCVDLCARVQADLFGRAIHLPQDRNRPTAARDMAREVMRLQPGVARPRAAQHEWRAGDGVLLLVGTLPVHAGVLFDLAGEWWVLHNDREAMASVLTRLREVQYLGFTAGGVYEWLPAR